MKSGKEQRGSGKWETLTSYVAAEGRQSGEPLSLWKQACL